MSDGKQHRTLYSALLRFWRRKRGMSQLDLALTANVAARHVSFLETGRSRPGRAMVLRLASILDVPLRDQNAMLRAAGFDGEFAEHEAPAELPTPLKETIERMKRQQEPFPLLLMDKAYGLVDCNAGGQRLIAKLTAQSANPGKSQNLLRAFFDEEGIRPSVIDWERAARGMLARLHREVLEERDGGVLADVLDELLAMPGVPEDWRQPDFSVPAPPVFALRFRIDGAVWSFITTVTQFSAPQDVLVEELRIESYYPLDEATEALCRAAADI